MPFRWVVHKIETRCGDAGESLLEVSRRLGQSSITITADVYAHVSPSTAHAAAERFATHLARPQAQPGASDLSGAPG